MTEICDTYRERLKTIDHELLSISRRREALVKLRETVSQALAQEEALANPAHQQLVLYPTDNGRSVADLVLSALNRVQRPMKLEDFKKELSRFFPSDSQPGRAINITLVGLAKSHHVERLDDGTWQLVSGESQNQ